MSKPITPYEDAIKKSIILYNNPEFERIADEFTMDMYVYVKEKFPGIARKLVRSNRHKKMAEQIAEFEEETETLFTADRQDSVTVCQKCYENLIWD